MSRNPFTEAEVSKNRLIKASNVESYMNERRDVACPVGKRSFSAVKFEVMDGKKPKVANDNVIKLEPEEEQNVSLAAKNNDVSGAPKPLSRVSPQMPSSCITFAPFLCRNSLDASGDKLPINGLPSLDTIKSRPSDYTPQSPIAMSPPKTPTVCRGRGRPSGRAAVTPSRTPKSSPPSRTPELLRTPVKASRCGDHDPLRTPKRDCKTAGLSPTEEGSSKFLRTPARVRTPVKRYSNAEGRSIDDDEEIVFKICLDIVDNIILHGYSYFDNRLFKELCENYGINGANRSRLSQIKGALVQSLKSGRVPRWADDNPIWREKMEQAIKKLQGTMPQRPVQAITNNNSDSMMELQHLVDRISGEMRRKDENTEKIKNEVGELNTIVVKMESELAKKDNEINKLRRELSVIELPLNEAKLKKQTTCPGDIVVTVNKTTDDLPLANNTLKLPEHTRLPSMTYEELYSLFNDMSQQVADKEKYLAEVKRMMREKQP